MNKIKKFFSSPKKVVLSVCCLVAVVALVAAGTVFGAGAIAQSSSVGEDNAIKFAFADAGIDPASAERVRAEFDFEQGQFVYEVEFTANGTEYDYWIKASDGSVVKKKVEMLRDDGSSVTASAKITLDDAREIALADAGLRASEVTFRQQKLDVEDGLSVYEFEFYTADTEYEYEINANTGVIYTSSIRSLPARTQDPAAKTASPAGTQSPAETASPATQSPAPQNPATQSPATQSPAPQNPAPQNPAPQNPIDAEKAKEIALSDAGVTEAETAFMKVQQEYEHGVSVYDVSFCTEQYEFDYEIEAGTGRILSREKETRGQAGRPETAAPVSPSPSPSTGNGGSSGSAYIGIEAAKEIAVRHAGLSVSGVVFSKAKLDREDGQVVYEIEFYSGGMEYEYTVHAVTGAILEHEVDRDD